MEAFSFAVTIVLGIVAIWLSVVFYRMSSEQSALAKKSADEIAASVRQLEALFDKMYGGVFGLMSETYVEMRNHIPWQTAGLDAERAEVQRAADAKIGQIRSQLQSELATVAQGFGTTDGKVGGRLEKQLLPLLDKAIDESRTVEPEARGEAMRRLILRAGSEMQSVGRNLTVREVVNQGRELGLRSSESLALLSRMAENREISAVGGDAQDMRPDTEVHICV